MYPQHPHVAPDNIEKGTGRLLQYRTVIEDNVRSSNHLFFPGALLYSKIRPNLSKAVLVDFEGLCSADMYPLLIHIESRYLHIFILSRAFIDQVLVNDNRVAMPKVNQEDLSNILVAVPPLAEQKRIVVKVDHLMSMLDDLEQRQSKKRKAAIHVSKASLDALVNAEDPDQLARAWERVSKNFAIVANGGEGVTQLRKLVVTLGIRGRLATGDRSDPPATDVIRLARDERKHLVGGKKTQDTNSLGHSREPLPAGWQWAQLADLLVFGPKNGISPKPVDYETATVSLTLGATTRGVFDELQTKFVDIQVDKNSYLWLQPGDILVQRGNTIEYVGVSALYTGDTHRFIYPDLMVKIRVAAALNAAFVQLAMSDSEARDYLRARASGTSGSMPKINHATLLSLPLRIPPYPEQKRIVARVTALMATIDKIEQISRRSRKAASNLAVAARRTI